MYYTEELKDQYPEAKKKGWHERSFPACQCNVNHSICGLGPHTQQRNQEIDH